MTNEEKAEEYEMNCIADVYRDDVCTIPYAYSAQKLEQAYLDGLAEDRKENEELKAQNKDLCESLDIMNNRESELLEQIEKMKNVGNCKNAMKCAKWNEKQTMLGCMKFCKNCKEWELAK